MAFARQSQAILETLINSFSDVVIFALDTEYRYLAFNEIHKNVMKEIWGVEIEIGKSMLSYIKNPEDREKAKKNFDRALSGESFVINEAYGDDELKRAHYENHYVPIRLENGEIIGLTLFLTEITERIRREEELKKLNKELERMVLERTQELAESEEKYKQLIELSPEIIGMHYDGKIIYINSAGLRKFRAKSFNDIIGKSVLDFVHPDSREKALSRIKALYEGAESTPFIVEKFLRLDGTSFEGEIASTKFNYKGKNAVQVYIRDISERLKAERVIRETQQIYRSAIENIPGVPYRINYIDNKYDYLGENIETLVGIPAKDLTFEKMRSLIQEIELKSENKFTSLEEVSNAFRRGIIDSYHADYKIKLKNGEIKWLSDSSISIKDEDGKVIGSLGILQDISQRKKDELRIIENEQKFRQITEQSSDGIILIGNDGRILEWNKSEEYISGIPAEEAIGRYIWDLNFEVILPSRRTENLRRKMRENYLNVLKGDFPPNYFELKEFPIFTKNNEEKIVQTSSFKIDSPDGIMLGVLMRDITAKEQIKRNLKKAMKLVERTDKLKSEFLAQISHEIRTPINVMLSFSDYIRSELEGDYSPEFLYGFEAIKNAGKRIIRTVDLILNVSELQKGIYDYRPENVDIIKLLNIIYEEEKAAALQKGLDVNFINNSSNTIIYIDEYSVSQIFRNLIDNAVKYTNEGHIDIVIEDEGDDILKVKVIDTGIGIKKEYLPRLFDLFSQEEEGYTRKFDGNGLGLALTKEYCKLNNAEISVESQKGKGSTFTVSFKRKR